MTEKETRMDLLQELAEKDRLCRELSQRLDKLRNQEASSLIDSRYLLLDAMMEGFGLAEIILDRDGRPFDFRLLEINDTLGRYLQIEPRDIHGLTLKQVIPNIDPGWLETLGEVTINQKPAQFEKYSYYFGKWFRVQAFCPGPGILGCLLIDITEQKRFEEAAERQNRLMSGINRIFAAVLKSADDKEFGTTCLSVAEEVTDSKISFLGEIGMDGFLHDIAASNPTWEKCSLAAQQDPKNRPRLPHIRGLYASVFTEGVALLTNDPASHPDSRGVPPGHPPLKCFMAAPLRNGGKVTGMLAAANRDGGYADGDLAALETLARVISESLSRRRAEKALIDGETRYRSLYMSSPDAIFVNQQDRVTMVNDACLRLFGARNAEDLLGKTPYDLYHPDYHTQIRERIRRIRELNETLPFYEAKIMRLDGRAVDVEVTSAGFHFGSSRAIHVILRDITERKLAAEDLKRSNSELEEFAYAISHDLQEPLRSITGFLQLFRERYRDMVDEKGQNYIDRTIAAGLRMKNMIKNLLSLSRVSTNDLRFVPTELNHVVGIVLENLDSALKEKNAEVICHELPVLSADANQIQCLFQNLITNAIKYNSHPAPKVEIGSRPCDNYYEIYVKDNGIGVLPQFHERIFQVFQRLHTVQEYEGIGMGLALCKKIVERHHGRIWVDSQPGKGATFYFTISANL